MTYDIIIVGAGAAGLSAAYKAIRMNSKLNILVLEKEKIPGRKLSAAGNGKCNLTNLHIDENCYFSNDKESLHTWRTKYSYQDVQLFFEEMGILLYENNGYFYPQSNQGKQVTNLLYEKSKNAGVSFSFQTKVTKINKIESNHNVYYELNTIDYEKNLSSYQTKHLLLATGGVAASKLGGSKDGYEFAKQLNLNVESIYPALTPAYIDDPFLNLTKGVRINAMVSLKIEDGTIIKEFGQVQFNDKSISGIVIMNLSSYFNLFDFETLKNCISLDVLPNLSWDNLKNFIYNQKNQFPNETLLMLLSGILPISFIRYILKRLKIDDAMLSKNMTEKQANRLTSSLKKLTFTPVDYKDFEKAQVTGGGISLDEISINTFECNKNKNLYIVGELLDINGKCGGYNLTFAILSGLQAINEIIRKYQND